MRDYSSISPSAKTLLLLKGLTDIPFIADAVELIWGSSAITALGNSIQNENFLKRLLHFELHYKSIDNLLEALGGNNILEISSGFSFRGLHRAVSNAAITYMDTDLPEVIETKKQLTGQLIAQQNLSLKGTLFTLPMNALDEDSFTEHISKLPPGPVTIVNEGLLVYLNTEEKNRLCQIIHRILSKRGGYWITADIYIRKDLPADKTNDHFSDFLKAHHVEDNKFESFTQAERFFNERGFKIHKKSERISVQLSALKYINPADMTNLIKQAAKIGRIRETWALVPAPAE